MINEAKRKIIIDTDPGHDDALAIVLLEKSNLFDIQCITTVAGNSSIQNVTNNTRYILDLIKSKTSIFSGSSKPLKRKLIKAVVHGGSGLEGAKIIKKEKLNNKAVDKIISIIRSNPNQVSILIIGPQTNIAKAFLKDSQLPKLIKELVIMGGAIKVPGNKNRVAEFNIFVDPEAAEIVFKANVKKVLIPLDISNDVYLKLSELDKIKKRKIYKPLKKMMENYVSGIEKYEKVAKAYMYDPLAAYYLVNKKAFKTKKVDICIETKGDLTRGMTVIDNRLWDDKNNNIDLVVKVDKKKFNKDLISILSNSKYIYFTLLYCKVIFIS